MPTAYRLAAVALLIAIFGTLGWDYARQREKMAVAQEQVKTAQVALKRLQATTALRERSRATTARAAASATASLNTALAAEPAWAEQPVPKEVQDAIKE
jgi:hypothetical protein